MRSSNAEPVISDETGLALVPLYPAQAMILLYRKGCPRLATGIEITKTATDDGAWLTAAGCLARQPGGPVEILQHAQVKTRIDVFDNQAQEIPSGTPGGILGGIIGSIPAGWPPEAAYRLAIESAAQPGDTLLRGGPHPVYYVKEPYAANWRGSDRPLNAGQRDEYALDILASSVNTQPVAYSRVHWLTPEQGLGDLQALAAEQRQRYADLLSRLMRQGVLTPVERTRCPESVEIEVQDSRVNRNPPLPSVAR